MTKQLNKIERISGSRGLKISQLLLFELSHAAAITSRLKYLRSHKSFADFYVQFVLKATVIFPIYITILIANTYDSTIGVLATIFSQLIIAFFRFILIFGKNCKLFEASNTNFSCWSRPCSISTIKMFNCLNHNMFLQNQSFLLWALISAFHFICHFVTYIATNNSKY